MVGVYRKNFCRVLSFAKVSMQVLKYCLAYAVFLATCPYYCNTFRVEKVIKFFHLIYNKSALSFINVRLLPYGKKSFFFIFSGRYSSATKLRLLFARACCSILIFSCKAFFSCLCHASFWNQGYSSISLALFTSPSFIFSVTFCSS